jgi:hypothetical protein
MVHFDFTDDMAGSPNSWDAVLTMKGWTDSYRVFQIYSSASSEGTDQTRKDTEPLYFRSGEDAGWGATREIMTFAGTTPNADGAANQILQTDGAGTLSWADLPTNPALSQYERYELDSSIPAANGTTVLLTFGVGSGPHLKSTYNPAITAWAVNPANTHIDILANGLYQFTFQAFMASLGTSQADYRIAISTSPSLTGDLLMVRNRTSYVDRHTSVGTATVYLTAGATVYFSVFKGGGNAYELGGTLAGPELRTFIDMRRVQ